MAAHIQDQFHYLVVTPRDHQWGLYVTAAGCQFIPIEEIGWDSYWVTFQGDYADRLLEQGFLTPKEPVLQTGLDELILHPFISLLDRVRSQPLGLQQLVATDTLAADSRSRCAKSWTVTRLRFASVCTCGPRGKGCLKALGAFSMPGNKNRLLLNRLSTSLLIPSSQSTLWEKTSKPNSCTGRMHHPRSTRSPREDVFRNRNYLVIDVLGFRKWAFFFIVIGANSILAYMGGHLIDFRRIADVFVGGVARNLVARDGLLRAFGEALGPLAALAIVWLILFYLYRKGTFVRV